MESACAKGKKPQALIKFENKEIVPGRQCGPSFAVKMWNKATAQQLVHVGEATKAFLDDAKCSLRSHVFNIAFWRNMEAAVKSCHLPGAAQYSTRHYLRDLCVFAGVDPGFGRHSNGYGRLGYNAKKMSQGGYEVLEKYGDEESTNPRVLKEAMVKVDAGCAEINFWAMTVNDCETNSVVKLFEVSWVRLCAAAAFSCARCVCAMCAEQAAIRGGGTAPAPQGTRGAGPTWPRGRARMAHARQPRQQRS